MSLSQQATHTIPTLHLGNKLCGVYGKTFKCQHLDTSDTPPSLVAMSRPSTGTDHAVNASPMMQASLSISMGNVHDVPTCLNDPPAQQEFYLRMWREKREIEEVSMSPTDGTGAGPASHPNQYQSMWAYLSHTSYAKMLSASCMHDPQLSRYMCSLPWDTL